MLTVRVFPVCRTFLPFLHVFLRFHSPSPLWSPFPASLFICLPLLLFECILPFVRRLPSSLLAFLPVSLFSQFFYFRRVSLNNFFPFAHSNLPTSSLFPSISQLSTSRFISSVVPSLQFPVPFPTTSLYHRPYLFSSSPLFFHNFSPRSLQPPGSVRNACVSLVPHYSSLPNSQSLRIPVRSEISPQARAFTYSHTRLFTRTQLCLHRTGCIALSHPVSIRLLRYQRCEIKFHNNIASSRTREQIVHSVRWVTAFETCARLRALIR